MFIIMHKFVTSALVTVALLTLSFSIISQTGSLSYDAEFHSFISEYGASYTSEAERSFRQEVFRQNMLKAAELQELNPLAEFGVTPFSDRTPEEMAQMMGLQSQEEISNGWIREYYDEVSTDTSKSKDWKKHMTPVRNQGGCGSCWSFAAIATIEGYRSIKSGNTQHLSEQELVDCVSYCFGCNGGVPAYAYFWLQGNELCTEDSYSYQVSQGSCRKNKCKKEGTIQGPGVIISGEGGILNRLQNHGPVDIAIDATLWGSYRRGIVTGGCGTTINHAVVATGFHSNGAHPYVTIKNSWGTGWGDQGYIHLLYGQGVCGMGAQQAYPIL